MRSLRINSLNNFPIDDTAVVIIVFMLYITSLVFIYVATASLYLLAKSLQDSI